MEDVDDEDADDADDDEKGTTGCSILAFNRPRSARIFSKIAFFRTISAIGSLSGTAEAAGVLKACGCIDEE
jgi:hypothetical protein